MSFSKVNPCPSRRCHKRTLLVRLLVFWVSFLRVVHPKEGTWFDMAQMAAGAHVPLATARQVKGFQL